MKKLLAVLLLLALPVGAQTYRDRYIMAAGDASGSCDVEQEGTWINTISGARFICVAGVWDALVPTVDASQISTGTIATARLGSGTANSSSFLRGDQTWSAPSAGGLPSGAIILIASGSCPTGFTEVSGLAGKFLLGTTAAAGDVGTTGGADNITPAGSVSAPTFTGTPFSSVINHTHPVSITDPGHTHPEGYRNTGTAGTAGVQGASTANNANIAAGVLSNTTGITASSSNPAGGVASITPAGTNSAPTFTGTQFDNRPAFLRVIFCSAN